MITLLSRIIRYSTREISIFPIEWNIIRATIFLKCRNLEHVSSRTRKKENRHCLLIILSDGEHIRVGSAGERRVTGLHSLFREQSNNWRRVSRLFLIATYRELCDSPILTGRFAASDLGVEERCSVNVTGRHVIGLSEGRSLLLSLAVTLLSINIRRGRATLARAGAHDARARACIKYLDTVALTQLVQSVRRRLRLAF